MLNEFHLLFFFKECSLGKKENSFPERKKRQIILNYNISKRRGDIDNGHVYVALCKPRFCSETQPERHLFVATAGIPDNILSLIARLGIFRLMLCRSPGVLILEAAAQQSQDDQGAASF